MSHRSNRREFLQTTAISGIGFWVAGGLQAKENKSANERIAFACIGLGSKGKRNAIQYAGKFGDVVALCDVDDNTLNATGKDFPKAKQYADFRQLFNQMEKSIDAVIVTTPDHDHAPAALTAMRLNKACYCEKPLAHRLYEIRLMEEVARKQKVVTQMGNHFTAKPCVRKGAAIIQSGALGTVKEVHVWTERPMWPQGGERPMPAPCPPNLDWDLWLGPAPERPYANGYHPITWRGWWDFGSGALGDMACHTMNMPYMGLNLRDPVAMQAETAGHNKDSYPKWSVVTYDFPKLGDRPALKMFWYDGGKVPTADWMGKMRDSYKDRGRKYIACGCAVIGDKDMLFAPGDYSERDQKLASGKPLPDVKFVESPGHFEEFVEAIKGVRPAATSNFSDFGGPLAETVQAGNLAVWVASAGKGERVEWDSKNLKCTNIAGLEELIKPTYRAGYKLDV